MTKFFRCAGCGQVLTGVEFEECEDGPRCQGCKVVPMEEPTKPDPVVKVSLPDPDPDLDSVVKESDPEIIQHWVNLDPDPVVTKVE